jgi:hypothetical protein
MEVTMKKTIGRMFVLVLLVFAISTAFSQQAPKAEKSPEPERVSQPDRAVVPLSNPAKPAKLEASVMRGSITVRGYDGKEVIAEARTREKPLAESRLFSPYFTQAQKGALDRLQKEAETAGKNPEQLAEALARETDVMNAWAAPAPPAPLAPGQETKKERSHDGMKLVTAALTGLTVEENNNTVTVKADSWKYAVDLTIQVPYSSSLSLGSSMGGKILVEDVSGEIEVNSTNGSVTLRNVSGNAVVHTMNGDIEAVLSKVSADKPLSFSNMNGDIDVTLPADIKASVKMKSQQGNIYSDFDVVLKQASPKAEDAEKEEMGKYRISFDKGIYGTINGGGQEITLTTFNGDIFIRKNK